VGGVGALFPARADQPLGSQGVQQQVQHPLLQAVLDHPSAELAEHRGVEPLVVEVQPERVLPGDLVPDRVRGLPIGQVLRHLQHRDQRQPARRPPWPAADAEPGGELGVREQLPQPVPHRHR
jgi:hypothetical protein